MFALKIFIYALTFGLLIFSVYMLWTIIDKIIYMARKQIPWVASNKNMRNALVREINANYPNMKTACDIGSGCGGLARQIARECNLKVWALESMLRPALFSKIADLFAQGDSKTVWCDAFDYILNSEGFDLAVAYLGPEVNPRLATLKNKIKILITLDVPVAGLTPVREISVPGGWTRYGREKYPNKLFVYKFK